MGQPIVQLFTTQADQTGINQIRAGIKGIQDDSAGAVGPIGQMGSSMTNVIELSKRPLERLVFRDIATSALGASGALGSLGGVAEAAFVGIETLGRAVLAFTGPIGLAFLGVAAFIEIIEKLKDRGKETAESIKAQTTELVNNSIAASDSADALKKLGVISSETYSALMAKSAEAQAAAMQKIQSVSDATTQKLRDLHQAQMDILALQELEKTSSTQMTEGQRDAYDALSQEIEAYGGLSNAAKNVDEQIKKLLATQQAADALLNKKTDQSKDQADSYKIQQMEFDLKVKSMTQDKQYGQLKAMEGTITKQVAADELLYIAALKTGDQAKIDSAEKRMAMDKAELASVKTGLDQQKQEMEKYQRFAKSGADEVASAFVASNGRITLNARKLAADLIKFTANQVAAQILVNAARDLSNPATAPIGYQEIAAAGIVMGIGNAAASLVDGGGASAGGSSGGSASLNTNANSPNGSGPGLPTASLNVVIQGGVLDDTAAINVAKSIFNVATQYGIQVAPSTSITQVA